MRKVAIVAVGLLVAASTWTLAQAAEKEVSVTGEVVDTYCFATMGAKGASHKQCGITCAKKGIPVGLLESGTSKLYVLLPDKDKGTISENVIDKMGDTVTISGQSYTTGGTNFLTVLSVK